MLDKGTAEARPSPRDPRRIYAQPGAECRECWRRHRTWHKQAQCLWPRAIWIMGNPPPHGPCFALVSFCHPGATVTLWGSLAEAEASKRFIDQLACGGRCRRDHVIYRLSKDVR